MRHQHTGKKLGRDSAHRRALYANLVCSLVEHGRIKTTEAKAKAVKPLAEQMITLGRRGDLASADAVERARARSRTYRGGERGDVRDLVFAPASRHDWCGGHGRG